MAVGRQLTTIDRTLVVHVLGAPIGFALITWLYYRNFGFTTPLQTASLVVLIVLALDLFLVAPVFERSFEMFKSPLGTWIPLALIFLATFLTGLMMKRRG